MEDRIRRGHEKRNTDVKQTTWLSTDFSRFNLARAAQDVAEQQEARNKVVQGLLSKRTKKKREPPANATTFRDTLSFETAFVENLTNLNMHRQSTMAKRSLKSPHIKLGGAHHHLWGS